MATYIPELPLFIGHRGAKALAPENTLVSIKKAAENGATWVEVDARLSADGTPILLHDEMVNRTSNGTGNISELPLTSIKSLDAGCWFDPDFSGEPIPTLLEALFLCRQLGLGLNIEIKENKENMLKTVEKIALTVKALENAFKGLLVFSSFSADILRALKSIAPEWPRGLLVTSLYKTLKDELSQLDCFSLHPSISCLKNSRDISLALELGLPLVPYTVNDISLARLLMKHRIYSFITDDPSSFTAAKLDRRCI